MNGLTTAKLAVQHTLNTAITAELARHPKKGLRRVLGEVETIVVGVEAPYAREYRAILSALAANQRVAAIATPRLGAGEYRRGADVTLIGLRRDVKATVAAFNQLRGTLTSTLRGLRGERGEDVATYRSSWLLGYRLGLTGLRLSPEGVRDAVGTVHSPGSVAWKSTGSGGWAGYLAAQAAATSEVAA